MWNLISYFTNLKRRQLKLAEKITREDKMNLHNRVQPFSQVIVTDFSVWPYFKNVPPTNR